jgi:manganese/zinc/iron transport system substrate-binding protein
MRVHILLVVVLGLLCSVGCQRDDTASSGANARPLVVATTTMIGDLVRQIGGDKVQLVTLMPAGTDPHSFKPSTGDMGQVARATLVLYNGLHLEGKMVDLLEQRLGDRAVAITRDMPRDRLLAWADGEAGAHDPHVWFDPTLWTFAAQTVAAELARIDSTNADHYRVRGEAVTKSLATLHAEAKSALATIPTDRRVLITSHDAFNYFGRAFEIDVRGLQGISTETQAGLSNINAAVDYIVQRKIPAIFVESSVPHATIERVVADAKSRGFTVKIGGELYSDAMGAPGEHPGFAVETYEGMFRYNVDRVVRGLAGAGAAN